MKVLLLIILVFPIFPARIFAQSGWYHLTSAQELNFNPYEFYFISSDTGFIDIRGENKSKFTKDGGAIWIDSTLPKKIVYPDFQNNGLFGFTLSDFHFDRTTDGGKTWVQKSEHQSDGSNGFYSVTPKIGFISGSLKKTTDSGNTFSLLPLNHIRYIKFRDTLHGLCVKEDVTSLTDDQYVFSTSDGGNTWDSVGMFKINGQEVLIIGLDYLPNTKLWRARLNYGMLFSHDDGANWDYYEMPVRANQIYYTYSFWGENIGYALRNDGEIYKTTDGGFTWTEQEVPDDFIALISVFEMPPYAILATSETTAYALFDSMIIKTTTGGEPPNSTRTALSQEKDFHMLMNPTVNSADFVFEALTSAEVLKVYDNLGRELFREELPGGQTSVHLNFRYYPSGIYLAQLGKETVRFIKQ